MPDLPDESHPETLTCEAPEAWTPATPEPVEPPARPPQPAASTEWRGTAAQAIAESARRFEGPTGFVRGDAAGDATARAVPAEQLLATVQSVTARWGDAGPVYTVRDDGSIFNTVTRRTEYVPVCLEPLQRSAALALDAPPAAPSRPATPARPPAGPDGTADAVPAPPESQWWTRPLGAAKMVGGVLETVAGGSLLLGGAATSEVGVGVPVAVAGGVVTLHGLDTTASGARMLWYGQDFDTLTSQGLQAAGLSRGTANLVDAGIGVVGSLGAGAGVKALSASGEVGAVSVAFRPAVPVGHNMVGVTTSAGTQWSHLVVADARYAELSAGSRLLVGGEALVTAAKGPSAGYAVATVPVSGARAEAALSAMQSQLATGSMGAYSYLGTNCATHAADVLRAGGVATPWLTTPSLNLASAALRSPGFVGAVSTSAGAVDAASGAASVAATAGNEPGARAPAPE